MLANRVEDCVTVRPAQHVMIQKQIAQLGRLLEVGAESCSRVLEVARLADLVRAEVKDV